METFKTYVGMLDKVRVIKSSPLLIRFTLKTTSSPLNCIVADKDLANKIMLLPNGIYNVAVTGHLNKRKQLVVTSLSIRNPDRYSRQLRL